jgi:hypothetical protein
MTREAAQAGSSHRDDHPEIAPSVGVQEDQDSCALAGGKLVPKIEWGCLVCPKSGYGSL